MDNVNVQQLQHQLSIQIENNNALVEENHELQQEIESLKIQIEVLNSENAKYKAEVFKNL